MESELGIWFTHVEEIFHLSILLVTIKIMHLLLVKLLVQLQSEQRQNQLLREIRSLQCIQLISQKLQAVNLSGVFQTKILNLWKKQSWKRSSSMDLHISIFSSLVQVGKDGKNRILCYFSVIRYVFW